MLFRSAVTGIAGPDGGTEEKPVGTVWFAVSADGYLKSERRKLTGDRTQVRTRSVYTLFWMLREYLLTR